jgi:hypothetical protein
MCQTCCPPHHKPQLLRARDQIRQSIPSSDYLSICLSVVYLSICLFVFLYSTSWEYPCLAHVQLFLSLCLCLPFSHLSLFFSLNLNKAFFFGNPVIGNLSTLHRKWFAVAVVAAAANVLSCRICPFIILDDSKSY